MRISLRYKTHLLHPLSSPQAADFPKFHDRSAPKWLLGCTAMAKFEAKKKIDIVKNIPPEIHVDIIALGLNKMHLLHPTTSQGTSTAFQAKKKHQVFFSPPRNKTSHVLICSVNLAFHSI